MRVRDKFLFEMIIKENNSYEEIDEIKRKIELVEFIKSLTDLYYEGISNGMYESKEREIECMNELLAFVRGKIFEDSLLIQDLKYNIKHEYDDNDIRKNIEDSFMRLSSAIGYMT